MLQFVARRALLSISLIAALSGGAASWAQQNIPAPRDMPYLGVKSMKTLSSTCS